MLLCILLALTGCTPSGKETPPEESLRLETSSSALESTLEEIPKMETSPENRVSVITPTNEERILEKKGENEDVVGWLTVPGTDIDTVIVHSPEKQNGFYTNHDFAGNPSKDGAYFADNRCDFTLPTRENISQNIALYAHSWDENPDGTLFAQLKRFKDPAFAEAHPYLFFSTEAEDMVWEVFAVYDATVNQPYIIPDLPWASLNEMLNIAYDASIYDYGIRPTEADKIITLSTCSFEPPGRSPLPLDKISDYRFVVMARLVSPDDVRKEMAAITVNTNPLPPDDMPIIYSHYADVIQYGGTLYNNLAIRHSDKIPEVDPMSLTLVGEVARSGVVRDLLDLDATKLPEGTPLYSLEGYENLLVAKSGEELLVYGYGIG